MMLRPFVDIQIMFRFNLALIQFLVLDMPESNPTPACVPHSIKSFLYLLRFAFLLFIRYVVFSFLSFHILLSHTLFLLLSYLLSFSSTQAILFDSAGLLFLQVILISLLYFKATKFVDSSFFIIQVSYKTDKIGYTILLATSANYFGYYFVTTINFNLFTSIHMSIFTSSPVCKSFGCKFSCALRLWIYRQCSKILKMLSLLFPMALLGILSSSILLI